MMKRIYYEIKEIIFEIKKHEKGWQKTGFAKFRSD